MALSCRCSSPRPALKERSSSLGPRLPLSSIFGLSQHDQRACQFIDVEAICPGGDDQFAELLHLAALEVARLVLKRFQFPVEVGQKYRIFVQAAQGHLLSVPFDGPYTVTLLALLLVGGVGVGALGSFLGIRRFLSA